MDIASIDYWANSGDSRLHRASALGKGVAALAFVAAVVVSNSPYLLASLYFLLLAGVFVSRLPASRLIGIAAYPTVFALFFAMSQWNGNLLSPAVILLKALTAAQAMVLLISTTPYPDVFAGIGKLMPRLLADGLFLTYRSFFLLLREMGRSVTALRLRGGLKKNDHIANGRNLARALGMLLVRAMDFSERLYAVLRVRGYRGRLEAGPRWRSTSRHDLLPALAGAFALSLAIAARVLPGLWNTANGFVLAGTMLLALTAYVSSRRDPGPGRRSEAEAASGNVTRRTPGRPGTEIVRANSDPGIPTSRSNGDMPARSSAFEFQPAAHVPSDAPHHHAPFSSDEIARVSCVRHLYPDGTEVSLCGLDFVAHRGERIVILGPNGAGKSTLLNHILGLLRPAEGQVRVLGRDPSREFASIQPKIGVLLQDVDDQLLGPTVADDVAFGARNAGFGEQVEAMAHAAMERLGILHLADKVPHYLSGGEKRKVALAGALVTNPDLLVADEPFEGLDPRSRGELVALLQELHRERDLTMIVTTHHVDLLPIIADTVYVLADGGRITARGTPEEVFAQADLLRESSIEAPTLTLLFQQLKAHGIDLGVPSDVEDAAKRLLALRSQPTSRSS